MDVGDVDAKAQKLLVGVDEKLSPEDIKKHLLVHAPEDKKELSERAGWEVAAGGQGRPAASGHSRESRGWEVGAGSRHSPSLSQGGELGTGERLTPTEICCRHPSPPCPYLSGTSLSGPVPDSSFCLSG